MTADYYLEWAEQYEKALATVNNAFARQHLETMVRSYRALADSERHLRKFGVTVEPLAKPTEDDGQ